MSDTSKDASLFSGTLTPIQGDSISGSLFSNACEAYFCNYVGTEQIQEDSGSRDKLMNSDFPQGWSYADDDGSQNSTAVGNLEGLSNYGASSVPANLFQDSCSLKLNTLPDDERSVLEDLISKINYHINYFVIDDNPGKKLKLICKLCSVTLRIAKVEAHVQNQEHLRNLTMKCKEMSETTNSASVSTEDWEFLDFDESSQGYQCTLCNENLSNSNNSWTKHFQSNSHCSKLKSSKPYNSSNSVTASNSDMNCKAKSTATVDNSKTVTTEMLERLKEKDKATGQHLSLRLKSGLINFKPTYKLDKLYFTCKACNLKLLPKNVEPHTYTRAHKDNLKQNLSDTKPEVTEKNTGSAKSNGFLLSSAQSHSIKVFSLIAKDLNKQDKKIIEDFGPDSTKVLDSFNLEFERDDRLNFICKICRLCLFPKYVKAHLYCCTGVKDVRKNKYFVNNEDLSAENKQIVKDLLSKLSQKKLFFFQLHCKNDSNQLGLYCCVCSHNSMPEHAHHHINSVAHLDKVLSNPYSLEFESLNQSNKLIVKRLTTAIKDLKEDFCMGYKFGTEKLRFYCKFCQVALLPETVEDHVRLNKHLNLVRHNLTVVNFDFLTDMQKKVVENSLLKSKMELNCVGILCKIGTHEVYVRCSFCNLILNPALLPEHVDSADHLSNLELSAIFDNFVSLEDSSKYILKNLYIMFGSKLNVFTLMLGAKDAKLQFKCKFCDLAFFWDTVNADWIANHLNNENHPVSTTERVNSNCDKTTSKRFSQTNTELVVQKTAESCNLSQGSGRINSSFITPNLHQTSLKEQSGVRMLKNNPSCENKPIEPYECHDCNQTINFNAEKFNGLRPKHREWLIVNCHGTSAATMLTHLRKREFSNCNSATCMTAVSSVSDITTRNFESNTMQQFSPISTKPKSKVLSGSDKETLKTLIDKVGVGITEFDFVLTTSSSELRLKCKFCSIVMRPEMVENHLNSQVHIKYSQLGNMTNLEFESLNNRNKKVVRKVFNQVGSEINDYDIDISLRFVCKVCAANVCPDSAQNHILSEEHLKHFVNSKSQDETIFGEKSCSDSENNLTELNIITEKASCQQNTQFTVQKHFQEYVHPLNIEYSDNSDDQEAEDEEMGAVSKDSDLVSKGATRECSINSKISEETLSKSAELRAYQVTAQLHFPAQHGEVAPAAVVDEKRSVSENLLNNSYPVFTKSSQDIYIQTKPSNTLPSPKSNSSFTNASTRNDSCRVINEPYRSIEMVEYKCSPCDRFVHRRYLHTHVTSNDHIVAQQRKLNGEWDIKNGRAFTEKIIEMFTGNLFALKHKGYINLIEIYYVASDNKMWFLCRMCEVMVCAEFFQKHWSHVHHLDINDKSQTSPTSNEIGDRLGMNVLQISNTKFQFNRQFICRICDHYTDLKRVLNHCNSTEHKYFLTQGDHPIRFRSYHEYKTKVLTMLGSPALVVDDFEVFHETDSSKILIYCSPCEKFLQPESLNSHTLTLDHHNYSYSKEKSETLNKLSKETSKNISSKTLGKNSKNSSSDSCSLM